MAHSNGTPVTRSLFALPPVTDAVPGNAGQEPVTQPVTGSVTLPLTPLGVTGNTGETVTEAAASNTTVVPLTTPERAQLTAKHWAALAANGAGQMWLHPGRLLHEMWHGQPQAMNTHLAYVKSRAWVPEELRGHKSGKFLAGIGVLHYVLIAWPLKQIGLGFSAAADRAIRFYIALAVVLVFVFAVVPHIHL